MLLRIALEGRDPRKTQSTQPLNYNGTPLILAFFRITRSPDETRIGLSDFEPPDFKNGYNVSDLSLK